MSENRLKIFVEAIDRLTGPFRKMGLSVHQFAKKAGFGKLAKAAARVGKSFAVFGKETLKLGGVTGVAAGGLFALVKATATFGDNLAKVKERLGLGIEWLQKHRWAAERADIATSTFDMAMQRFVRRTAEAAAGTGVAKDALEAMGVSLKDNAGNMRSSEDLLADVADGMAKIKDPAVRVRIAFALFDSEGVKMVNMLKNGSAAMKAQADEAAKLGLITEEQARMSEKFNDNLSRLWRVIKHTGFAIANELMPYMDEFIIQLKNLAVVAKPQIVDFFRKSITYLKDELPATVAGIITLLAPITSFVSWVHFGIKNTIGWTNALKSVAGIMGGYLLRSVLMLIKDLVLLGKAIAVVIWRMGVMALSGIKTLIASLFSLGPALAAVATATWAWTAALLANPLTWIIVAIVAAGAAAWYLVKNWDQVSAALKGAWDDIKQAFIKSWDQVSTALKGAWDGIKQSFKASLIDGLIHILANFTPVGFLAEAFSEMTKFLSGIDLFDVGAKWMQSLGDGISAQWRNIQTWLANAISSLTDLIPDWAKDRLNIGSANISNTTALPAIQSALPPAANSNFQGNVRVSFENPPAGMRIKEIRSNNSDVGLDVDAGLAMGGR